MVATDLKTKIPEGWQIKNIANLCSKISMGETLIADKLTGEGIPVFSANTENRPWGYTSNNRLTYSQGTIIVGARGSIGFPRLPEFEKYTSTQTTIALFPKINSKYLYYLLSKLNFSDIADQQAVPMLTVESTNNISFIIPENPKEQQKIAEVLTTIDEAIEKTDAIIEKNKRIQQGLMQDLFRYGIDEHGNIRSEKTHKFKTVIIGNEEMKIPEEWEVKPLLKTVSFIVDNRGKTPPNNNSGDYELIESSSISFVNRFPDYSKVTKFVNEKVFKLWFRDHPVKGDVLISTVGEYSGSSALLSENRGTIAQNVVALRFGLNDARYMFYWTRHSQYWHQIGQVMMNQAQPSLKVPHLLKFSIQLPTIREQTQIADNLFSIDEGIEKEMIYKQKLLSFKRGLMEDLLTGKVRVNSLIN